MRFTIMLIPLCLVLFVAACSSTSNEQKVEQQDADTLYNKAAAALDDNRYKEATKLFEEVERQHPYSKWATQSQLMSAYASYQGQNYDDAILSLDRFIELHPGNKDVAYAYYLKALSFYEQISNVRRDQQMTKLALDSMETLIRRFPDSKYVRDAKLKKDLTLDHLAGKEMDVGRYYLNLGEANAAINRFLVVIRKYETTTHTPEALHRLVESYLLLGLKQEAFKVGAVLGYNYPGSKWYERSYNLLDSDTLKQMLEDRSFIDRAVEAVFKPS